MPGVAESHEVDSVHFSERSGAMFLMNGNGNFGIKETKVMTPPAPSDDNVSGDVAYWGSNNKLPQEMTLDIERTGVLVAGIEAKSRIAIGKGPTPALVVSLGKDGYEELEFPNDPEISDWLEMNNALSNSLATVKDLFSYGNAWSSALFNSDRSYMMGYKRLDATEVRFEKWNKASGRIENILLSSDWDRYNVANENKEFVKKIALLNRDYPLLDLRSRTSGNHFAFCMQYALSGRKYYAPSPWYSAMKWVKICQGVPEMKSAMFKNQMNIKYLIEVHPDFWKEYDAQYATADPQGKQAIKQRFYEAVEKHLVGGDNSFKSIWSVLKENKINGDIDGLLKITAVDDKIKDGKLLPDSAAANIEILLPLMINSALLGVDMPGGGAYSGGAGSGSNIREAFLVQVMLVEQERNENSTIFDTAKHVNGWAKRYPGKRLVLRYPNQILTTLNTGANTQATA